MCFVSSWNVGRGNEDGSEKKTVGNEGRSTDEGGEEGNLAGSSEGERIGSKGAIHDSIRAWHNCDLFVI